jgi:hypothetical protein
MAKHRRIRANSPCVSNQQMKIIESSAKWTRTFARSRWICWWPERLFDPALGGKPVDVTIYQS